MPPSPPPLKIRHSLWGLITAVYAALVLVVAVVPVSPQLAPGRLDKVAHLCEYALFAWLLAQVVRARRMPEREDLRWAWIYAMSYGLLIELLQAMLPWRSAEVGDLLANAVGAWLGVWMSATQHEHKVKVKR